MKQFKITERYTNRSGRAVSSYINEVEKHRPVTSEEEVQLALKIQNGDLQARNKLATANLRFVLTVAKMYTSRDPELYIDLVSAGNIGLIEAAERFDPSRGFKFISFAVWYIRKEMLKYLADNSRTIRIPPNKVNALRKVLDVASKLTAEQGVEPTMEEITKYIKDRGDVDSNLFDPNILKEAMNADRRPASLDMQLDSGSPGDGGTLHDVIPSKDFRIEDFMNLEEMETSIIELTSCLSPLEKTIVLKKHGLSVIGLEQNYGSIGYDLKLSGERVRQIYIKALKKMKIKARRSGINQNSVFAD